MSFQVSKRNQKQMLLDLADKAIDVNNWSDYIIQSEQIAPIGNHTLK